MNRTSDMSAVVLGRPRAQAVRHCLSRSDVEAMSLRIGAAASPMVQSTAAANRIFIPARLAMLDTHERNEPCHDDPGHRRRRLYRQPHGSCAGGCRRARRRAGQSFDRLCLGDRPRRFRSWSARPAIRALVAAADRASMTSMRSSILPPRSWCRIGRRSAGLLSQQHREFARPDRDRDQAGVRHFIFSSTAAVYGNPLRSPIDEDDRHGSDVALWLLQADDGDHAARCRQPRTGLRYLILRYFNVAGADPRCAPGSPPRARPTSSRSRSRPRSGCAPQIEVFGTDYPTPDGTCIRDYIHVTDLVRAHSDALRHLRGGGASVTLNCGYGRGFSVLRGARYRQARLRRRFQGRHQRPAARRSGRHRGGFRSASARSWAGRRSSTTWRPSSSMR